MFEGMKELHTPGSTVSPAFNERLATEEELFGHLGESARAGGSIHTPASNEGLVTEEELMSELGESAGVGGSIHVPNEGLVTEEELMSELGESAGAGGSIHVPNEGLVTEEELLGELGESAKALGSSEIPNLTLGPFAPNTKAGFLDAITAAVDDNKNKPSKLTEEELFGELGESARVGSTEIPTLTLGPNAEPVHIDLPQWLQKYPQGEGMELNTASLERVPLSAEYPSLWSEEGSANAWELLRKTSPSTMATRVDWGKLVRIDSGAAVSESPGLIGLGVKEGIGNGVVEKLATEGGSLLRLPEWAEVTAKVAETLKIAEL